MISIKQKIIKQISIKQRFETYVGKTKVDSTHISNVDRAKGFYYRCVDIWCDNAGSEFDECTSNKHHFNFGTRTYNRYFLRS